MAIAKDARTQACGLLSSIRAAESQRREALRGAPAIGSGFFCKKSPCVAEANPNEGFTAQLRALDEELRPDEEALLSSAVLLRCSSALVAVAPFAPSSALAALIPALCRHVRLWRLCLVFAAPSRSQTFVLESAGTVLALDTDYGGSGTVGVSGIPVDSLFFFARHGIPRVIAATRGFC